VGDSPTPLPGRTSLGKKITHAHLGFLRIHGPPCARTSESKIQVIMGSVEDPPVTIPLLVKGLLPNFAERVSKRPVFFVRTIR
jgi:hypothetical protein